MAKQDQPTSPEINEPLEKLQKTNQNGVSTDSPSLLSLLRVKKISENATLPSKGSPISAGYDLSSATSAIVSARDSPCLSVGISDENYARIAMNRNSCSLFVKGVLFAARRSGLPWNHSIDAGTGMIDADYRGPVGVILCNHSDVNFEVKQGDQIAQLII